MYQADTLIADEGRRGREKEEVREALRICGYPEWALKEGEHRGKTMLKKEKAMNRPGGGEKQESVCHTTKHERCHRATPEGIMIQET